MKDKLEFKNMLWDNIGLGAKEKRLVYDNKIIRLLSLDDQFVAHDWCSNGHIGFVLKGEFTLQYLNEKVSYNEGDVLIINSDDKHKAILKSGGNVELFLIEKRN